VGLCLEGLSVPSHYLLTAGSDPSEAATGSRKQETGSRKQGEERWPELISLSFSILGLELAIYQGYLSYLEAPSRSYNSPDSGNFSFPTVRPRGRDVRVLH
jgi:hypothetical protein